MRHLVFAFIGIVSIACAYVPNVQADVITLAQNSTLSGLLGGEPTWWSSLTTTEMNTGNMHSRVYSQVCSLGDWYVYLYQVDNTGVTGNSSVELFSLGEFTGSVADGQIGYLTDTGLPTGFFSGGRAPEDEGYIDDSTLNGLEISFYYGKTAHRSIAPGQDSRVMFIVSNLAPGMVVGNVIDGIVATGPVVGPVPEPGTLVLLGGGGLGLVLCQS